MASSSQASHEASEGLADASSSARVASGAVSVPSPGKAAAATSTQNNGVRKHPTLKGPGRALLGSDPALVSLEMLRLKSAAVLVGNKLDTRISAGLRL